MKKRITKIWGIALVVALLAGLIISPAPAAAKNLDFTPETLPSTVNYVLRDGTVGADVTDIAVGGDGSTIFAAAGTTNITKSTNAGAGWTAILTNAGNSAIANIAVNMVAIAPDDNNFVAIADNATGGTFQVYVTTNGGVTWSALTAPTGVTRMTGMDLSAAYAGNHYVAVSGLTTANTTGQVWYYKLGVGAGWTLGSTKTGWGGSTSGLAVQFSPNFASDQVLTAVTANATGTAFQMFSLNLEVWNASAGFDGYPATIEDSAGTALDTALHASIALSPTYLGGDETERLAFVGITATSSTDRGVYRLEDNVDRNIKSGVNFYSLAYNGTNLVAGETYDDRVWRSPNPLETSPTFYQSTDTKSPSGVNYTVVAWSGVNVVAGTTGNESAFAVSKDDGRAFNDISLIDTAIGTVEDLAVSADGNTAYFASNDGADLSVWRLDGTQWVRVLSRIGTTTYIIRIAPGNHKIIYVADPGTTTIYYSSEGGDTRWYTRTSRFNIQDIAVESTDVAYIAISSSATVSKTTNAGFSWGDPQKTDLVAGFIQSITSVVKDQVLVGGMSGYVSYSTDGNATWSRIQQLTQTGSPSPTLTWVASANLTAGGFIYAYSQGQNKVTRWSIGQPQTVPWADLEMDIYAADVSVSTGGAQALPLTGAGMYVANGIALRDGVLYAFSGNGAGASAVFRTLEPTTATPTGDKWSSWSIFSVTAPTSMAINIALAGASPSNGIASGGAFRGWSGNKVWAVVTTGPGSVRIRSCIDTLTKVAPVSTSPASGSQIRMNPISGLPSDVAPTWGRASEAFQYEIQVAYDNAFVQKILTPPVLVPASVGGVAQVIMDASVSRVTGGLDFGTTYYWRARVSADGPVYSPWSETRSVTVEAGAAVVTTLITPVNGGSITSTTPAFSWNPVSSTTNYRFQLAETTSFAAPLVDTQLPQTGIAPAVKLEVGKTYFWRVKAVTPIEGDFSAISNFTITEPAPAPAPPVVVQQVPPPVINLPPITMPPAVVNLPPTPAPQQPISSGLLWAVIIIGAVLVIALIVLIIRTRRTV